MTDEQQLISKLGKDLRIYKGKLVNVSGERFDRHGWDGYFEKLIDDEADDPQIEFICRTIDNFVDPAPSMFNIDRSRKKILDAGCGIGKYSVALTDQGYTVVGIDHSESAMRSMEERRSFGVVICDVESLPFKSNYFDVYLSWFADIF